MASEVEVLEVHWRSFGELTVAVVVRSIAQLPFDGAPAPGHAIHPLANGLVGNGVHDNPDAGDVLVGGRATGPTAVGVAVGVAGVGPTSGSYLATRTLIGSGGLRAGGLRATLSTLFAARTAFGRGGGDLVEHGADGTDRGNVLFVALVSVLHVVESTQVIEEPDQHGGVLARAAVDTLDEDGAVCVPVDGLDGEFDVVEYLLWRNGGATGC